VALYFARIAFRATTLVTVCRMRVVMRLTILYNTLWIPQEHRSRDGLMRRLRGLQLKYRLSRVQNAEHQQVGLFYSDVKGVMAWMN
jgi:hypothetical protein